MPATIDLQFLAKMEKTRAVFEDFENGIQDWSSRDGRTIKTYKFQSPDLDVSNDKKIRLTIDPKGKKLSVRLNTDSKFLSSENNQGNFSYAKVVGGDKAQEILIRREEFKGAGGKKLEWAKIATFEVTILDQATKSKINLTSKEGHEILKRIELVDAP